MLKSILFDHKCEVIELTNEIDRTEKYLEYLKEKRVKSLKILLEVWRIEKLNENHD